MSPVFEMASARLLRVPACDNLELLHASYSGPQQFPQHCHEEFVVSVMARGAEILEGRGGGRLVAAGSVILLNPGEWHATRSVDAHTMAYRSLYAPVGLLERLAQQNRVRGSDAVCLRSDTIVADPTLAHRLLAFHAAAAEGASDLELAERFLEAMLWLLARHAHRPPPPPGGVETRAVRCIRAYLDDHFQDTVALADLSALTDLSPFHLVRTFRKQVGLPPHAYQQHLRVRRAKQLLRAGEGPARVAAEVGFADQSHLTRHFKRLVGVPPGQFAAAARSFKTRARPGA